MPADTMTRDTRKSKDNIQRSVRALRKIIETSDDSIEVRMAQVAEEVLRWASEDVRGWNRPEKLVSDFVELIRKERLNAR